MATQSTGALGCFHVSFTFRSGFVCVQGLSAPAAATARLSMLVPNDKDSDIALEITVYDRVREHLQREDSAASRSRCSKAWVSHQEICYPLELDQKALGNSNSGLLSVEIDGGGDILFGVRMQRIGHRASLVRRRAMASCPGTATVVPDSSSASLLSASSAHVSSTSGSKSRLAMSRPSRCDRSAGASFRASASKTSKYVLKMTSEGRQGFNKPQLATTGSGWQKAVS